MRATITNIINETNDIKSFRLHSESLLSYTPGQWMYVKLDENLKHHFTISSSPTEPFLQFTTVFREESNYKKALWTKKVGDDLEINGPFGGFILDEKDTTPRLFIAGGIGITPFRSMIKYWRDKKLTLDIKLLYSVKSATEAAFGDELKDFIIVESEKEGRLDEGKIKKYCPDWQSRSWWMCGAPAMVAVFMELGEKMGMASEKLKSEDFTGY